MPSGQAQGVFFFVVQRDWTWATHAWHYNQTSQAWRESLTAKYNEGFDPVRGNLFFLAI